MRFSLAQSLTDTLLLRDMATQFFDVTAGLLSLRGGAFDILHVGPISEMNNGNNRNRRGERKEADVANKPRDEPGRGSAGKVRDRCPQKVFPPGNPDLIAGLQGGADRHQN